MGQCCVVTAAPKPWLKAHSSPVHAVEHIQGWTEQVWPAEVENSPEFPQTWLTESKAQLPALHPHLTQCSNLPEELLGHPGQLSNSKDFTAQLQQQPPNSS